jgi:hypothetical protein
MLDQFLNSLSFVGVGIGVVAVFCLLEVVLRSLTNRYGTPQLQR